MTVAVIARKGRPHENLPRRPLIPSANTTTLRNLWVPAANGYRDVITGAGRGTHSGAGDHGIKPRRGMLSWRFDGGAIDGYHLNFPWWRLPTENDVLLTIIELIDTSVGEATLLTNKNDWNDASGFYIAHSGASGVSYFNTYDGSQNRVLNTGYALGDLRIASFLLRDATAMRIWYEHTVANTGSFSTNVSGTTIGLSVGGLPSVNERSIVGNVFLLRVDAGESLSDRYVAEIRRHPLMDVREQRRRSRKAPAAAGSRTAFGSGVFASITGAGSATVLVSAAGSGQLAPITGDGQAEVTVTAAGSGVLSEITGAGQAEVTVTAAGDGIFAEITGDGRATNNAVRTAAGAGELAAITGAGMGWLPSYVNAPPAPSTSRTLFDRWLEHGPMSVTVTVDQAQPFALDQVFPAVVIQTGSRGGELVGPELIASNTRFDSDAPIFVYPGDTVTWTDANGDSWGPYEILQIVPDGYWTRRFLLKPTIISS